ncbi:hypothetical protein KA005_76615, partial [bacterium]|nr:hypothetical protein [bacterium]
SEVDSVYTGEEWDTRLPEDVGLDVEFLQQIQDYMGGWGVIVRHGYLVYSWGKISLRQDIASAGKPIYSHFLMIAVEQEKLASYNEKVNLYEPCLNDINPDLDYKDRDITFRHMANQISAYVVTEDPGTSFNYNDWQMALFWDTLFLKVFGADYNNVDDLVFDAYLNDILVMQDDPTMMAFGTLDRPGRVAISVRDLSRFGLLYLREGKWNDIQVINRGYVKMLTRNPVPNSIPRTEAIKAEMCAGQRTQGSGIIPDDQFDHGGSYSWLWWINGEDEFGNRKWLDGPLDTFAALGHTNGKRGLAVIPSLDIVIAWNETNLDQKPESPHPLNEVLKLLKESIIPTPEPPTPTPSPTPIRQPNKIFLPLLLSEGGQANL